jgi:hypothetical protein
MPTFEVAGTVLFFPYLNKSWDRIFKPAPEKFPALENDFSIITPLLEVSPYS